MSAWTPANVDVKRSRIFVSEAFSDVSDKLILSKPRTAAGVRWTPVIDEAVMDELEKYVGAAQGRRPIPVPHGARDPPAVATR